MIRIIQILFFTTLIAQPVFGQNVFMLSATMPSMNYTGFVYNVWEDDNGNYFYACNHSYGPVITKTDEAGYVLWSHNFKLSSSFNLFNYTNCSKIGNDALIVHANTDTMFITRIGENGNVKWTRLFQFDAGFVPMELTTTDDQEIRMAGEIRVNNLAQSITVYACDSSGNFLFGKNYSSSGLLSLKSFRVASDQGFILTGSSGANQFILKTNDTGNILWNSTFNAGNGSAFEIHNSGEFNDGSVIATGRYYFISSGYSRPFIMKFDQSGNLQYLKYYLLQQIPNARNRIHVQSNNDFWFVSDVNYTQFILNRLYMRCDSSATPNAVHLLSAQLSGNSLNEKEVLASDNGFIEAFVTQFIGDPVFFTKSYPPIQHCWTYNSSGQVFISTLANYMNISSSYSENTANMTNGALFSLPMGNSNTPVISYLCGNTATVSVEEIESSNFIESISPNPAGTTTNIIFNLMNDSKLQFEIFDTRNRKISDTGIRSFSKGNNVLTLDVSGLITGLYFVHCVTSQGTSVQKLCVYR